MAELNGVNGTTCDAEQYQQFVSSRDSPSPSISCLTRRENIGLVLAAETSSLSFVFVVIIFIRICWNVRWYRKKFPKGGWKLLERPLDIYMLFLFIFDCIQAIGGMLNIWWAHIGIVRTGPYCTVQGTTQQAGELGVALMTLILAIHTFVAALWPVGQRACGFAFCMVALTWVFIALWVGIGAGTHKNLETPTPYWCWISPQFPGERLAGEYIWLWAALFASVILYIPLHFWAKGRLSVHKEKWWRLCVSDPAPDIAGEYPQRRAALGMLSYPAAYTVIVLPLTIARWLLFTHHDVTSAVTFFAISVFYLSGAINVVLFLIFKPRLLLFHRPGEHDLESEVELASLSSAERVLPPAGEPHIEPTTLFPNVILEHAVEPTASGLVDRNSRSITAVSGISSRRRSSVEV